MSGLQDWAKRHIVSMFGTQNGEPMDLLVVED